MLVTVDQVRELLARVENPKLDFKSSDYDWDNEGNNELAKDLMATGNVLPRGTEPGYILIGVNEATDGTGIATGVSSSSHLDDAKLHQKVSGVLNRTPSFSYMPVDIDGKSIGVYEVRPGGRPFYALRDSGKRHRLKRFEARYRNGSATEVASPDQIIEWSREDDVLAHEIRELELEKLRIEAKLCPSIHQSGMSRTGSSEQVEVRLTLRNDGDNSFDIARVWGSVSFTDAFYESIRKTGAVGISKVPPFVREVDFGQPRRLRGGTQRDTSFKISRDLLTPHIASVGLSFPSSWTFDWFDVSVEMTCMAGSRTETAYCRIRF
jgi:hypothetical protein